MNKKDETQSKLGNILNDFYRNENYTTKMAQRDIINLFKQEIEAEEKTIKIHIPQLRRADCIIPCIGPDCEGCRNYQLKQEEKTVSDECKKCIFREHYYNDNNGFDD